MTFVQFHLCAAVTVVTGHKYVDNLWLWVKGKLNKMSPPSLVEQGRSSLLFLLLPELRRKIFSLRSHHIFSAWLLAHFTSVLNMERIDFPKQEISTFPGQRS